MNWTQKASQQCFVKLFIDNKSIYLIFSKILLMSPIKKWKLRMKDYMNNSAMSFIYELRSSCGI